MSLLLEDHDEPGADIDRFLVETRDKSDDVIEDLSMGDPAVDKAVNIEGGNVFVPHGGGNGKGKN